MSCKVIIRCAPSSTSPSIPPVQALPPRHVSIISEACGRGYIQQLSQTSSFLSSASSSASSSTAAPSEPIADSNSRVKEPKEGDYYELLGLYPFKFDATKDEIELGYKKALVVFHPDKRKTGNKDIDDQNEQTFLEVKKAYQTLLDPIRKRSYDSICDMDEEDEKIPSGKKKPKNNQEFYDTYAPVFKKNARFSVHQPVPELGDDSLSMEDVDKFYNFWFQFESWRDFTLRVAEDPDGADERYERRKRLQKSKKEREKLKKADMRRLTDLVDRAYKFDPRVKALKAWQKEQKKLRRKGKKDKKKEEDKKEVVEDQVKEETGSVLKATLVTSYVKKQISRGRRQLKRMVKECRQDSDAALTDDLLTSLCQHLCLPSMLQVANVFADRKLSMESELAAEELKFDIGVASPEAGSKGMALLLETLTEFNSLSGKSKEDIVAKLAIFVNGKVFN